MTLIGDPLGYARSIRAMRDALDIETVVPGDGGLGSAGAVVDGLLTYLEHLTASVGRARAAGQPVSELYDRIPMEGVAPMTGASERAGALARSLHRLNILLTYRWMERAAPEEDGYVLVRQRCSDFASWFASFESLADRRRAAGLRTVLVSRDGDDPDQVVVLFSSSDPSGARGHLASGALRDARRRARVVPGSTQVAFLRAADQSMPIEASSRR